MNSASQALVGCPPTRSARRPANAQTILQQLERLQGGRIHLILPDGERLQIGAGQHGIELQVHDWRMFDAALGGGDIGFGDAYMDGLWDTPEPARLLTLLARNRGPLQAAIFGQWWRLLPQRLLHGLRANTRRGSRRNIVAHYDLGNDFYALWLDPGMSYSSALYAGDYTLTLEQAQSAKYRRILDRLQVQPGQEILEIGCGWGAFAELAAREYGARVLGVTLSARQLAYARQRVQASATAHQARFELCDYRDVQGRFDHVVSIEMFEAVGERYWPVFFDRLHALLRPGGGALVQSITVADSLFARYRRGTDFIQRYIFPGGMLPSPQQFAAQAARARFRIEDDLAFGQDYAQTLAAWLQRFEQRIEDVRALARHMRFERMWRFYLAYCEAGFRAGSTDVHQFHLVQGEP